MERNDPKGREKTEKGLLDTELCKTEAQSQNCSHGGVAKYTHLLVITKVFSGTVACSPREPVGLRSVGRSCIKAGIHPWHQTRPEEENGSFISGTGLVVIGMAVAGAAGSLTGEKAPSDLSREDEPPSS